MTAIKAFSLLDEGWIAVQCQDGTQGRVGLTRFFEQADRIVGIAETAPASLIALHRIALAILHRALVASRGQWTDTDRARWYRDGLPVNEVLAYLEHWRERFWLFHPAQPFMQVPALAVADETRDRVKPWTQIALERASGNTPLVFDHSLDDDPRPVAAAAALCDLLGFLQFTPGGLVKVFRGSDKAGPLVNTAAVVPIAQTVARSLLLGLHPSDRRSAVDLPAWEAPVVGIAGLQGEPEPATGPCDRYTRLSRAVLLLPEDEAGRSVRWIRFGAGRPLLEDEAAPDPMSSFRPGAAGWVRVGFVEGRAAWRDLGSLLPDAAGRDAQPAAVLSWAASLYDELDADDDVQVMIAGLSSDKAKLLRWRCERFVLPGSVLRRAEMASLVRSALAKSEDTYRRLRDVIVRMHALTLPDSGSKDARERARQQVGAGTLANVYFGVAAAGFAHWLTLAGQGELDAADSRWDATLLEACRQGWQVALTSIGQSPSALRAQARCHGAMQALLHELRPPAVTDAARSEHRESA